jgi:hypothetical protein
MIILPSFSSHRDFLKFHGNEKMIKKDRGYEVKNRSLILSIYNFKFQ